MKARYWMLVMSLMALPLVSSAAEKAQLLKDVSLKEAPYNSAETVDDLSANTSVTVLQKKGLWTQVRTRAGLEGWVKTLSLKGTGSKPESSSGGGLNILKTGGSGVTVTTGVKGLDAGAAEKAAPAAQKEEPKAEPAPTKADKAKQVLELLKGLK